MLNKFTPAAIPRSKQAMLEFLTGHFRYPTMNSWNDATSYAHNVKVTDLNFPSKAAESTAWDLVGDTQSEFFEWELPDMIHEFERESGYTFTAGFNGRSGGYLVLYPCSRQKHPYDTWCTHCGRGSWYPDGHACSHTGCTGQFKKQERYQIVTHPGQGMDHHESFEDWDIDSLRSRVKEVIAFDKFTERVVECFVNVCADYTVEEQTVMVPTKIHVAVERGTEKEQHAQAAV